MQCGKTQIVEDETPLTCSSLDITEETTARFNSLLLSALGQETQKRQKHKDKKSEGENGQRRQKSGSRKSKQRNAESISGSNSGSERSKEGEVTVKQRRARKDLVLNKKLKNETNESKASHAKNIDSSKDNNDTENGNEVEVKSGRSSSQRERASSSSIPRERKQKKPVPLPRQKSLTRSNSPPEAHKEIKPEDCFKDDNRIDDYGDVSLVKHEENFNRRHLNNELLPKIETKKKKHKNKDEIELQQLTHTAPPQRHTGSPSPRRKKSSKLKQRAKEKGGEAHSSATTDSTAEHNKIIGVHIHKSDFLKVDPLITHPVIKVSLFDAASGNYLKKSVAQRPASFFYESEDVDYILPLMTEAFDYKVRKSLIPQWEELLMFNENFEYILRADQNVLFVFEILDFVNFEVASSQYRKLGAEGGWHRIAWAFLKPVGANGILNVNKQFRLQLYKPWKSNRSNSGECEVYQWWISGKWEKYPATLYVTLSAISPPEQLSPALRSRSVLQGELSEDVQLDIEHNDEKEVAKPDNEDSLLSKMMQPKNVPLWSRLPLQSCQIPNKLRVLLPTASKGCLRLQFSNNGYFLACATVGEETFDITVYTIPEGKLVTTLRGHLGLVYDLSWSSNDSTLISASADCTACLWNMEVPTSQAMQMLPHPSFVYSAVFHPGNSSILVTGCCDHVVRVWSKSKKSLQYEFTQELEGHSGFINAIAINILTNAMYTGDSKGGIIEWTSTKVKPKRIQMQWKFNRKFEIREIEDTVVNRLVLHPQGKRLLIHARDSRLRMLDIATGTMIQWYTGALNHRFQTHACISPCGGLVISGSEDGAVYVWQTDTGEQLAVYSGLQFQLAANAVHYHPHEHMVAFGSYGSPAQVIVCSYDSKCSGKEIGLQVMSHKETGLSVADRVKQSTSQADGVEDAVSASNVKLTSILEKMDRILQNSSSSLKKASESL